MKTETESAVGSASILDSLQLIGRVLTFRVSGDELRKLNWLDLTLGLFFTWLAAMGRYWDNLRVETAQALGAGSVAYVFALALFLYLIIWPMRPANWTFFRVLTFITLTAPPALLYAIPFQTIFPDPDFSTANTLNAWLLAAVAVWRVALLNLFLRRLGELPGLERILGLGFPLTCIIVALTVLNLEKVVFHIMGGFTELSPNDTSYEVLFMITTLASVGFIPFLIAYIAAVVRRWSGKPKADAVADSEVENV